MDEFEAILDESQVCVAVLRSEQPDFQFLRVKPALPQAAMQERVDEFTKKQYAYRGVIALADGQIRFALTEPLDPYVVQALTTAFLSYVGFWLRQSQPSESATGDAREWLERLYLLPDPRT